MAMPMSSWLPYHYLITFNAKRNEQCYYVFVVDVVVNDLAQLLVLAEAQSVASVVKIAPITYRKPIRRVRL